MRKIIKTILILTMGLFLAGGTAFADLFGFDCITHNSPLSETVGEAQLLMNVNPYSNNTILFNFLNIGPFASSITDIYFDDDVPLLSFNGFIQSPGVVFTVGADPSNLPGGAAPLYHFSSNYSYDSDKPVQPMGVNPGESLGIVFGFLNNADFDTVIAALNANNPTFRVGLHVQGFSNGKSEGFIDTPNPAKPVPEPATMLMLGTGFIGLAGFGRKRLKK